MSVELTEAEAREELSKLSLPELIELANGQGKPTGGLSKTQLVELLLGKCPSCKGNMTVIIIGMDKKKLFQSQKSAPCVGCGK